MWTTYEGSSALGFLIVSVVSKFLKRVWVLISQTEKILFKKLNFIFLKQ